MSERPPQTESELVQFVRAIDVRAPQELHGRIEELIAQRSTPPASARQRLPFGRPGWLGMRLGAIAAVAAVAIVALVVALTGTGGLGPLSPGRAYALTQGAAGMPAPSPGAHPATLSATVEDVAFPNWQAHFGWRSAGERIERVGARSVTTVFYEGYGGRRIGYAIVAGRPAPKVSGGGVGERVGDTTYRVMSVDGGRFVTWVRDGRLCVIGGQHISAGALLALASWS
jgi:hypothetical protein